MDERLNQHLETQLRNANAANHELRTRVEEADRVMQEARAISAEGRGALMQLEKAHAKQKAAEDNAAAAQSRCADAQRELLRARRAEELRERLDRVQLEADELRELNSRIADAQHARDSFAA
jgi:hypothetical protein